MEWHHLIIFLVGLAAGYGACHFKPITNERRTPRSRARAIPRGTDPSAAPRKHGRPRKAQQATESLKEQTPTLNMDA